MHQHHYFMGVIFLVVAYVLGAKFPVLAQKAHLA